MESSRASAALFAARMTRQRGSGEFLVLALGGTIRRHAAPLKRMLHQVTHSLIACDLPWTSLPSAESLSHRAMPTSVNRFGPMADSDLRSSRPTKQSNSRGAPATPGGPALSFSDCKSRRWAARAPEAPGASPPSRAATLCGGPRRSAAPPAAASSRSRPPSLRSTARTISLRSETSITLFGP